MRALVRINVDRRLSICGAICVSLSITHRQHDHGSDAERDDAGDNEDDRDDRTGAEARRRAQKVLQGFLSVGRREILEGFERLNEILLSLLSQLILLVRACALIENYQIVKLTFTAYYADKVAVFCDRGLNFEIYFPTARYCLIFPTARRKNKGSTEFLQRQLSGKFTKVGGVDAVDINL